MLTRPSVSRLASLASALALVLTGLAAPLHAQHSNGFTYYKITGPGAVDSTGQPIPGSPAGYRTATTDGTNVFFTSHLGSTFNLNCTNDRILYRSSVTGGAPVPVVTSSTKLENAEPTGTSAAICTVPVIANGNLIFGADYTPAGGTRRFGFFTQPVAGGAPPVSSPPATPSHRHRT
jgi:hypothetical protein